MTKLLNQLTITAKPEKTKLSPIEKRQQKLIAKLTEQQEMAKCLLEGVEFTAYKFKSITDPETHIKNRVKVPKRIRPWFYQIKDSYFLEIKYGSKSLELAKGKTAITVSEKENLPDVIATVINAVKNSELDAQLNAIQAPARKAK
ncbi:hypothetical protein DU002_12515 [Corallincola holothuriorum]|uniref:Uncharacterized protein n=1 Tax=Corallincola holothuriorum TaxID=2282215 RepID=A0A368NIF6_9GAMM|nr:DUF6641 family protein [Corallincola holothuriorum]RCU49171.1 hypothetical protein DU002_12515 [Corallincola holothuriorum]